MFSRFFEYFMATTTKKLGIPKKIRLIKSNGIKFVSFGIKNPLLTIRGITSPKHIIMRIKNEIRFTLVNWYFIILSTVLEYVSWNVFSFGKYVVSER